MNIFDNNKLLDETSDALFDKRSECASNVELETVLRYIALSKATELSSVKLLKYEIQWGSASEGSLVKSYSNNDILIITDIDDDENKKFIEKYSNDWVLLDKEPYPISSFLSYISPVQVYIDKAKEKVIITAKKNQTPTKWYYRLCSALFRALPWIYNQDENPTAEEQEMFSAFAKCDAETIVKCCNKVYEKFDIKSLYNEKILLNFCKGFKEIKLSKTEDLIRRIRNDIEQLSINLSSQYDLLGKTNRDYDAILALSDNSAYEFKKFFQNRKCLSINRFDEISNYLAYNILETIEYFDEDEFLRMYKNKKSILYSFNFNEKSDVMKLCIGLFNLKKGKVRAFSTFAVHNLDSIVAKSDVFLKEYAEIAIGHPHLYGYACLGGNQSFIEEYMAKGDWEMAIEQTIAAAKNINFGDSTVMKKFLWTLRDYMNKKIIIENDGTEVTPLEFINHISNDLEAFYEQYN